RWRAAALPAALRVVRLPVPLLIGVLPRYAAAISRQAEAGCEYVRQRPAVLSERRQVGRFRELREWSECRRAKFLVVGQVPGHAAARPGAGARNRLFLRPIVRIVVGVDIAAHLGR